VRLWNILQRRLHSLFLRDRHESDLSEELRLHLEREIERLQATGLPHDEARRRARQLFGGVEQIKEAARDARGTAAWDALVRDTRHGLRRLVRDWRFTTAAVLILGIGIGANTAIFSLVNAALFRDQPLPDPERLVDIYENDREGRPTLTSHAVYEAIAERRDVFASVTASFMPEPVSYRLDDAVRGGLAEHATPAYLDVLGLRPTVGRWFDDGENRSGAPLVVVLGHQFWTRQLGADPSAVGRTIRISGLPATIVGVGPAGHRGTINIGLVTDFWLPLAAIQAVQDIPVATDASHRTNEPAFLVKARLNDGRTVAHAQAAVDIIARQRDAERRPDERDAAGRRGSIAVFASTDVRIHPQADALVAALASVLLVVVGLVLAIASSNLATLLLVRGATRAKEVSVRLAIGATRRQIVRHLLTESLLLSLGGGLVGCLLAWWGVRYLRGIELPITVDVTLDVRVLAFALALSVVTGVLFGLAPALKATRVDLLPTLRDEGTPPIDHRRLTLKHALIVFQVSLSVLLLGGTSVFLQMLTATRGLPVAFAVDGVAAVVTDVRYAGYTGTAARNVYDELLRRIAAIPGVESASLLRGLPIEAGALPIVVEGQTSSTGQASMFEAGPGFLETMRIPLLYGRGFDARDQANTPRVAVISERMARQYFGAVNAVGRRFRLESDASGWTEVIGIARDTGTGNYSDDVLDPIPPPYYRSHTQSSALPTTIIARTSRDTTALLVAMQRELRAFDIALPIMTATTMAQVMEGKQEEPKAVAMFLGVLGGLGLMLASIGLYAVVAFAVARRSREIGIRMALGAHNRQVAWSVARGVAGLISVGTGAGLLLSVLLMWALRALPSSDTGIGDVSFYRPEIDPVALLAIAGVMALVGVVASFVPARRATQMDPLAALRHE
jgi:predicted permease